MEAFLVSGAEEMERMEETFPLGSKYIMAGSLV
jgi:hypothetical protein